MQEIVNDQSGLFCLQMLLRFSFTSCPVHTMGKEQKSLQSEESPVFSWPKTVQQGPAKVQTMGRADCTQVYSLIDLVTTNMSNFSDATASSYSSAGGIPPLSVLIGELSNSKLVALVITGICAPIVRFPLIPVLVTTQNFEFVNTFGPP